METNLRSFKSARKFSVFCYGISHGPLLLRSGKTDEHHTRIDVLIKDVRALEIRSWFEGLEISEVDRNYLRDFPSNPLEMMEVGLRIYALSGKGWQGFVVGGNLCVHEDDADFMAPSALLPALDTGNEVDKYGRYIDPAEAYQQFMLKLFDVEEEARELAYSKEALARLHEARLVFLAEFKEKFPGYGKGRAVWE
jgi:hypothetical protein